VSELVEDVLIFSHSNAVTENVHVERHFDETLPPVWGDRTQLQQVFLNLILNALDSFSDTSKDNRHVVITTRHENETEIHFSVKDTGCGIDESIINDVFNPFVTTKKEGMGMGLAINRTIIQAHGGRIWAENNPDGGAIFNVVLPVKREEKT
ncbi:MAG: ATP-binding protein, partial [Desulfobacterales bacterium]|nr:ATP-binding protein [Desulfobacterales bacterium]